jgi:hypothetical protein
MKKIFVCLITILFITFTGCSTNINNTPTKKVEEFLNRYQTLDSKVISDLDRVVEEEEKFNTSNREDYKELIKNQYKDMTYMIKNETINGDKAIVEVEITVKDYKKVMDEAEVYRNNNMQLFSDELGNYKETMYIDYVIKQLKEAKDTVKYTLELGVTKKDKKWQVDQISDETEDKILGIYNY